MNIGRNVNVSRKDLLDKLRDGRAEHVEEYQVAKEAYHEAAVKFLGDALKRAKKGDLKNITFMLQPPQSHVGEYDTIIAMMEASVDEVINLDSSSFKAYYMGEWEWKRGFDTASAMIGGYLGKSLAKGGLVGA